jgi:hypothetical protein
MFSSLVRVNKSPTGSGVLCPGDGRFPIPIRDLTYSPSSVQLHYAQIPRNKMKVLGSSANFCRCCFTWIHDRVTGCLRWWKVLFQIWFSRACPCHPRSRWPESQYHHHWSLWFIFMRAGRFQMALLPDDMGVSHLPFPATSNWSIF